MTKKEKELKDQLRIAVIARDRGCCVRCNAPVTQGSRCDTQAVIYPVFPIIFGGNLVSDNMVTLCRKCYWHIYLGHVDPIGYTPLNLLCSLMGNKNIECYRNYLESLITVEKASRKSSMLLKVLKDGGRGL